MSEWTKSSYPEPEYDPSKIEAITPPDSDEFFASRPSAVPAPRATQGSGALTGLVWLFASLVVVYFVLQMALPIVREYRYAGAYGEEKARVEAALEGLNTVNLQGFSSASRLVAKAVGPSVVHISTSRSITHTGTSAERSMKLGLPVKQQSLGQGSGVVVDAEGYILTNNHVIDGAEDIRVHMSNGRSLTAKVVGFDTLTDLAVLKVESEELIPAQWGDSEQLQRGDMVWAFGNPFGLEQSVTFGIVSAKGRTQQTRSQFQEYLQTDVAVNPGNSGGPLVNVNGEIVGVNTAIVGNRYQGISFAVPSSIAKDVYEKIRIKGRVARGMLGVRFAGAVTRNDESQDGAKIARVILDSPADRGGIQRGDVIVGWDGTPVGNSMTLSQLVAETEVGEKVSVDLKRKGKSKQVVVTIVERVGIDSGHSLRFRD